MQTLSLNSLIQTFLIGLFLGIFTLIFHFMLRILGLRSNRRKILNGVIFLIAWLIAKATDYPVSRLIDYFLGGRIQYSNMYNAFKTFMLLCTSTVITSALSYFYWDELLKNKYNTSKLLINVTNIIIYTAIVLIIMATVFKFNINNLLAASGLGAFILGRSETHINRFFYRSCNSTG